MGEGKAEVAAQEVGTSRAPRVAAGRWLRRVGPIEVQEGAGGLRKPVLRWLGGGRPAECPDSPKAQQRLATRGGQACGLAASLLRQLGVQSSAEYPAKGVAAAISEEEEGSSSIRPWSRAACEQPASPSPASVR